MALPCNEAKQIEIHSQNPRNVYLPKKNIDNKFRVIPSSINHIQIQTKTFTADVLKVVVNAIGKFFLFLNIFLDHESGFLVYSWLLMLASLPPAPTKHHKLQAKLNSMTLGKY